MQLSADVGDKNARIVTTLLTITIQATRPKSLKKKRECKALKRSKAT